MQFKLKKNKKNKGWNKLPSLGAFLTLKPISQGILQPSYTTVGSPLAARTKRVKWGLNASGDCSHSASKRAAVNY